MSPIAPVRARHYDGESDRERDEVLAVEEPLELRIHGVPIAVVMRTPGHDEELAMGFLVTERIVKGAGEVVSIRHCTDIPSPEAEDNVVQIRLAPGIEPPLERLRRNLYASSSCGVCGKATIASALGCAPPIDSDVRFDPRTIQSIPEQLRAAQAAFEATGGLHAAALFDGEGELLVVREDVGRHNAVDKIVGASEHAGIDRSRLGLFVSGRVSFELVQKAAAARIAVIAGISAPTSLAVAAGRELGVTVVGFVRGASMNVYSEPSRIASEPSHVASEP